MLKLSLSASVISRSVRRDRLAEPVEAPQFGGAWVSRPLVATITLRFQGSLNGGHENGRHRLVHQREHD
jgi:hypothetical protein